MYRVIRKLMTGVLTLALLAGSTMPVRATETEEGETAVTEIHSVQQLQQISENPSGSFVLMTDLDMTGIEWVPLDFSGSFDGNGHAILNLTLTQPGNRQGTTYDGNSVKREATMYGLFGTLTNATVTNLKLLNVRALVEREDSCFVGGLAGFAEKSTITDCTVTGNLELRAQYRIFGVGGLVGYGTGRVERCTLDVTLITVDTDKTTRDEQFLGGVLGAGLMDILDCNVTIDGYISEFGYVHSGGLVGMTVAGPVRPVFECKANGNTVTGKITFFECNTNRRAYCDAYVGEKLFRTNTSKCQNDFLRDERTEYDQELRPEMCENPVYAETVIPGGCENYGYTSYTCETCGYTYKDRYTGLEHTVLQWTVTQAPTTEAEGVSTGYCACGMEFTRAEPKLDPTVPPTEAPTEAPAPTEAERPAPKETSDLLNAVVFTVGLAAVLLIGFWALALLRRKKD